MTGRFRTTLTLALTLLGTATASATAATIAPDSPLLRYEGRWQVTKAAATTVNTGSRVFLRFTGSEVNANFDRGGITEDAMIYTYVDGTKSEPIVVDHSPIRLTPEGLAPGTHTLAIAAKRIPDANNRWIPPLQSALHLTGITVPGGTHLDPPPPAPKLRFTFLGDSITEGLNLRCLGTGIPSGNTPAYCNDATFDYAWLTAAAFGAGLEQVGFGFQGITVAGSGNVPPAPAALDENFQGSPAGPWDADVVVINEGTNDMVFSPNNDAAITAGYLQYLRKVRQRYPNAFIIALEPFGFGGLTSGTISGDIRAAVTQFDDPRTASVPTFAWLLPPDFNDSLHPNVHGHELAASHLIEAITDLTGLKPLPPVDVEQRVDLAGLVK